MFIGRQEELKLFEKDLSSDHSEFCIIYGRRRIGKSTLIDEFIKAKKAFSFLAGHESKRLQIKNFVAKLSLFADDPLIAKTNVTEWNEALTLLDRTIDNKYKENSKKIIVFFDEFQWMCNGALELLSDIQRFWDQKWQRSSKLFLILCGSSISFMLGDVLSRKSPLFGRRTRSIHLQPFSLKECSEFLPKMSKKEITRTFMLTGGVPQYLEIFAKESSFKSGVQNQAFSKSAFFLDEISFILSEQLKEKEHYFLVLLELSYSSQTISKLSEKTSIATGQITYYLERLQLLGFVKRYIPFGSNPGSKMLSTNIRSLPRENVFYNPLKRIS